MDERQTKILAILGKSAEVSVSILAELLNISQVTVRKDIDALVAKGYVTRRHGMVCAVKSDNIAGRLLLDYEKKRAIAELAAPLVSDGDTVIIESGSTCAILAKLLAETKRNLTIVTNSFFIADFIRGYDIRTIVLGGEFQPESQVCVGPLTALCLKEFYGKFFFCGVDGMSQFGFTVSDHMRADTARRMGECANTVCVLTTSDKFSMRGVSAQLEFVCVDKLFTDSEISNEEKEIFAEKNIELCTST